MSQYPSAFDTMGNGASDVVNASGAYSRYVAYQSVNDSKHGMVEGMTAAHRQGILEPQGAQMRITAPLYQQNAAEASSTYRNVRIMPPSKGSADFWNARAVSQF